MWERCAKSRPYVFVKNTQTELRVALQTGESVRSGSAKIRVNPRTKVIDVAFLRHEIPRDEE